MVQPRIQPLVFYRGFPGRVPVRYRGGIIFLYPGCPLLLADERQLVPLALEPGRPLHPFFLIILILVLNVFSEITFWEEFNVRYNFIAVDYLVYTNEVLGNIWQSYNIPLLSAPIFLMTILLLILFRKRLIMSQEVSMRF